MSPSRSLQRAGSLWPFLLAGLVLLFVLVNARWVWLFRHAQPLDVDEAGYLGIALADYHGLLAGGLRGWLQTVEAPSTQAPVTTALASLVYWLAGPHAVAGFAVPALAGAIVVVATYLLARCLVPPAAALAAAALVGSCPIILNYSRSFHFAMPATAVMTLALLCLARSDKLSRFGWATLFGICLGLLPLARTMTIAFLPGLVLGAAIHALAGEGGRGKRLALLAWTLLMATLTAARWLLLNGTYVFQYLVTFGYGSRAVEFGPKQSFLGLDAWLTTIHGLVSYIYVPHALVLLAGLTGVPVLFAAEAKRRGSTASLRAAWRSPALPVVVCVTEALVVLTSSQNRGSAFVAPIVPAMLVLAVWVLFRLSKRRCYRCLVGAIGLVVCVVAAVPLLDSSWPTARPWAAALPGLGPLGYSTITDGRSTIQLYEHYAGFGDTPAQPLSQAHGKAWLALDATTAATLQRVNIGKAPVAFGFRHFLYNVNTVRLPLLLAGIAPPALIQVEPMVSGDTVDGYEAWLTKGEAASACLLLTLQGHEGEFPPPITKSALENGARQAGFLPLQRWSTPDGRDVVLWRRHAPHPPCQAE